MSFADTQEIVDRHNVANQDVLQRLAQYHTLAMTLEKQANQVPGLQQRVQDLESKIGKLKEVLGQKDEEIGRLTEQLQQYADHPDVKAAKLRTLQAQHAALSRQIADLAPPPAEKSIEAEVTMGPGIAIQNAPPKESEPKT